jgi:3-dehydroquinate dehydratase type I
MRICIPITALSTDEALIKMEKGFDQAPVLELRIDGITGLNLEKLLACKRGEILVTNRTKEEGGAFAGSEEKRVGLLKKAVALGADYLDLELRTDKGLIGKLRDKIETFQGRSRLILSFHDFRGTPSPRVLMEKLKEGYALGADIVKIVTQAGNTADNLKVLPLIPYARKKGLNIIAFCMGEEGKISRVMAPLLGSYLTYASLVKGEESAPGQIPVGALKRIFNLLGSP